MAERLFDVDASQLLKLTTFYAKAPKKFAKATGSMLTDFAFGTRTAAIEVIREKMVVRSGAFVERQLRVEKSHRRLPIQSQESEAGSVATKRFTGWKEQQTGQKTARERVINLLARRGSPKRKAAPKARLKPGRQFESYRDYPGRTPETRSTVMLQILGRKRWKEPFLVTKKRGILPGLYRFKNRKLRALQLFGRKIQPKRVAWLTIARDRYFQREDIGRLWARTLGRILRL